MCHISAKQTFWQIPASTYCWGREELLPGLETVASGKSEAIALRQVPVMGSPLSKVPQILTAGQGASACLLSGVVFF